MQFYIKNFSLFRDRVFEKKSLRAFGAKGSCVAIMRKNSFRAFGAKRKYDKYQIQEIMHKRDLGQGYGQIAKAMGMSRSTVSTIVKRELDAVVGIQ